MYSEHQPLSVSRVAVVEQAAGTGPDEIARMFPAAEVVTWHVRETSQLQDLEAMHAALVASGGVQAILDYSADATAFKSLFLALPSGGMYILKNVQRGSVAQFIAALVGQRLVNANGVGDEGALSRSLAAVRFTDDGCVIEKAGDHVYKVRDEWANRILGDESRGRRFRLLSHDEPGTFQSRVRVRTNNRALHEARHPSNVRYPGLSLRSYVGVSCYPGQVYRMDNVMLPDTFRRIFSSRLASRAIQDDSQWFAAAPPAPQESLDGVYYALDSELAGHFGHFTTEVLGRGWGWNKARASFPSIKALLSPARGNDELYPWQYELLNAAGISPSDVHVATEAVRVEQLVAATPMFGNPRYVHPDLIPIWRAIGRRLANSDVAYERLFVSRKPQTQRSCTNAEEVERYFRAHGFAVIYPEDHQIGEQIAFFDRAQVIAGFAGSGMFNLMFAQNPKKVIVIGSAAYDAVNEYLIMAGAGGELTYVWCEPLIPMGKRWSLKSFMSDFHFDFKRDGPLLDSTLGSLP